MPARHVIETLQAAAIRRGGKCLSTTYVNNKTHYLWECGVCQNQWKATWNNVSSRNSWCPKCNESQREKVTRAAFCECFPGYQFDKDQKTIDMELDGFCPELKLAFEHDGIQHHEYTPHFHRGGVEDFHAQVMRDREKNARCIAAGITLVRVPDKKFVPLKSVRDFVRAQLKGVRIAPKVLDDATFVQMALVHDPDIGYVRRAIAYCADKWAILWSDYCPTRATPIHVQCDQGHMFETNFDNLERGRWCPECSPVKPRTADLDTEQAAHRGMICTGSHLVLGSDGKRRRHLELMCHEGHVVEMIPENIMKATHCPECWKRDRGAAKRPSASKIDGALEKWGLKLAGTYKNNQTPTVFECLKAGHKFTSSFVKVKNCGTSACIGCFAEKAAPLELVGTIQPETVTSTKLNWKCYECGSESVASIQGIKIRLGRSGNTCQNKKCDSRM